MIDTIKDKYFYFESGLSHKFCDDVIKLGVSLKDKQAMVRGLELNQVSKKEIKDMKKNIRDSKISWTDEKWMYREILPFINFANTETGWNFQHDWIESLQFTKYKKGQYYGFHADTIPEPYTNKGESHNGKIRKLSFSCQLSDPNDYEGGELEFAIPEVFSNEIKIHTISVKEFLPKGSIIVFPSYIWHRIKPIKKGVRYSLVSWVLGYPFK